MTKIIPRWEWRTFGSNFEQGEDSIREYECLSERTNQETYILSKHSNNSTKIRDDLIDIKTLVNVSDSNLEQWMPVMREDFPISLNKVKQLFGHWKVSTPTFEREEYTYGQFIDELVNHHPDLALVKVEKTRFGYNINDTIVEIAETKLDGSKYKTLCVEHADPEKVISTVKELSCFSYENINYIKAMKRNAGWI